MAKSWRMAGVGAVVGGAVLALALSASGGAQGGGPPPDPATFPKGDAARGETLARMTCFGCHGQNGVSNGERPRLAGQRESYLTFQLVVLRGGQRPAGVMNQVASKLSDQNITDLAAYFSAQPVGPAWEGQDAAAAKLGQALFMAGDVKRGLTACAVCHGSAGLGVNELGVATIRHQSPKYVVDLLTEYKNVPDFGAPVANAMHIVADKLSDSDMQALAAYLATMQ